MRFGVMLLQYCDKRQKVWRLLLIPLLDIVSSVLLVTIIAIMATVILSLGYPMVLLSFFLTLIFLVFYFMFYHLQRYCRGSFYLYFLLIPLLVSFILFLFVLRRFQESLPYADDALYVMCIFLGFVLGQYVIAFAVQGIVWMSKGLKVFFRKIDIR